MAGRIDYERMHDALTVMLADGEIDAIRHKELHDAMWLDKALEDGDLTPDEHAAGHQTLGETINQLRADAKASADDDILSNPDTD